MADFPELSTDRLLLRQPTAADADAVFRIFSDEQVLRYYNIDLMTHRDEAVALIGQRRKKFELGQGSRWGIYLKVTGLYIGSCGFELWHRPWRFAEIGYELSPDHWRQGIMSEALTTMIQYGIEAMHLHRVEAQVDPDNIASRKVLLGLGFKEEGRARERGYWHGEYHDLLQFGLLTSEFKR